MFLCCVVNNRQVIQRNKGKRRESIELNYSDHRPIYEQKKEKNKEYIINGAMSEYEKLPSVREVAEEREATFIKNLMGIYI